MRQRIVRCLKPLEPPSDGRGPAPDAQVGDFNLNPDLKSTGELRPASVLVPLVQHGNDDLRLLLTQRTEHLHDHAGQISFPGGRAEAGDSGPVDTALRETEEELDLKSSYIDVAGFLDYYETGTGYLVTPVVGFVTPGFTLAPDTFEVADVFEVPLAFFLDERNHRTDHIMVHGMNRRYHVFEYGERYIWGATAGMLVNLLARLAGETGDG